MLGISGFVFVYWFGALALSGCWGWMVSGIGVVVTWSHQPRDVRKLSLGNFAAVADVVCGSPLIFRGLPGTRGKKVQEGGPKTVWVKGTGTERDKVES